MRRVCVLLAFVCALFVPSVARADGLESFTRGLESFAGNGTNEQVTPERDWLESYEPEVREVPTVRLDEGEEEESSVLSKIQDWVQSLRINNNAAYTPDRWWRFAVLFMTQESQGNLIVVAVGIVFMWWGVRKSMHMIMSAFRSGRLSFGDRKVRDRNSYYYGTRPSDWR